MVITMARFDADSACLVIDVWGNPLHFQVRFPADQIDEHDDEIIRQAAQAWRRMQEHHTLTAADLRVLQQAQVRLLNQVRRTSW